MIALLLSGMKRWSRVCYVSTPDVNLVIPLRQGLQIFSIKAQIVNILGFAGHLVPLLCCCIEQAAVDNMQMSGCGCVPIKFYNRD